MSRRLRLALLGAVLCLVLGQAPPTAAQTAITSDYAALPADLSALHFSLTKHNLAGGFLRQWWEGGQLSIFGYPISEELAENGRTVQYFERARFEYHADQQGTPYLIQLSLLGRDLTRGRTESAFQRVEAVGESPDRAYISATGHTIGYGFKTFWENNNGLATFGYPISEELDENGQIVQYFERARFEYHPEHQGTPHEVQLGHLGRAALRARELAITPAPPLPNATTWTDTLPVEVAQRLRTLRQQAALTATPTPVEPFQAVVAEPEASIRRAPTTIAPRIRFVYARHILRIVGEVAGEPITGDERWYQLANDAGYVPAAFVRTFTPPAPPRTWAGRWIDVNLTSFYATGYEGDRPIYSALVTAGRQNRTPTGIFAIQSRVEKETMDSATVGFPKGHPEYYFLENVLYTQYFAAGGVALHGNYWVHPSLFGRFSSNGCIGLQNPDAAWFWEFATFGTPVNVHF